MPDLVGQAHGLPGIWAEAGEGGPFQEDVGVPEEQVHQGVEGDGADPVGADGPGSAGGLLGEVVMAGRLAASDFSGVVSSPGKPRRYMGERSLLQFRNDSQVRA